MQPHEPRQAPVAGDELKDPIGRRDKPFCKCDSLGLERVEELVVRAALQHRGKLPRQIYRVADARVHSLAADGTVNVRSIAQKKRTARTESNGDAMMHVIGREPIHALHVDAQTFDDAAAYVFPLQRVVLRFRRLPNPADETRTSIALHWKNSQKIHIVERGVQLMVHHRTAPVGVGDVEQMTIGSSREAGAQLLADDRARAIATRKKGRFAGFIASVRALQMHGDAVSPLLEADHLGGPIDVDAFFLQPRDQKPLMLILRVNQHVWIRAHPGTDVAESDARGFPAAHPQVGGGEMEPFSDQGVGDTHLPIQLEGAGVHHQRARGSPGLGRFVDNAHAHAEALEPKRQDKAGGSGAGDQNIGVRHGKSQRRCSAR